MLGRHATAALLLLALSTLVLAQEKLPAGAQKAFDDAFAALDAGKPAEALPLYEKSLELAPDSWQIWLEYASCLRQLNRQPAAVRAGWRTVQLAPPKKSDGWVTLGNIFCQAWQFEAAASAYESALTADGDKLKASSRFTTLGYEAEHAGEREAALHYYSRAIELDSKNAVAHADKGRVLFCTGGKGAEESDRLLAQALKLAQKQKDSEACAYALVTTTSLNNERTCKPWSPSPSFQPIPHALLARPAGDATQTALPAEVERRWRLPTGRHACLVTPEPWHETEPEDSPKNGMFLFTAKFDAPRSNPWDLQFSLLEADVPSKLKEVRRFAEVMMAGAKYEAAEPELTLVELKGPGASGWYFTATDKKLVGKTAGSGEWPYLTQGILEAGGTWFAFTLLTHSKEASEIEPVLAALRTLKVQ